MDIPAMPPAHTRQRLLDAAGDLLDEAGQDGVSLRAVAKRVGVTAMATYKHFADKQDLLVAISTIDFARLGTAMDAADRPEESPKARMAETMTAYVKWGIAHPERYRLMFGREIHDAVSHELTANAVSVYRRIETAVDRCTPAGAAVEPAKVLAGVLLATAHGAIDLHLTGHVTPVKGLGQPELMVQRLVALLPF